MLPWMTPFVLPKLLTHWGLTFLIVLSLCQTGCWKDTSDVCRRWGHLSSLCNTNRVWGNRKIISFAGCKWKTEGEPVNVWLPGRKGGLPAWRFADKKLTQQLCQWKHHEETRVTGQAVWPKSNPPACEEGFTYLSPWEASENNWGKITARQQDGHRLKAQSNGSEHVTSSVWYYNGWTAVVSHLSRQKCQTDQE